MFNPLKNFAISWSEDCQGKPLALTTVLLSTNSFFVLEEKGGIKEVTGRKIDTTYIFITMDDYVMLSPPKRYIVDRSVAALPWIIAESALCKVLDDNYSW